MPAPSAKRRKTSPPTTTNGSGEEDKHAIFTKWASQRGVETINVEAKRIPGRGLGLRTTKKIKKDARILFVPEEAMFKLDPSFLKRNSLDRTSAQAQLAVYAMAKFSPSDSELRTWEDTWPTREDFRQCMPLYWDAKLQDLVPSAVRQPFDRQRADFEKDWLSVEKYCKAKDHSKSDFCYYWMIVNSRSFHWKPARGPGSMCMCPYIDYMNHGPTGSTCTVYQRSDGYEVLADRDYAPGEEILATYGSHSNDKLLVHYGFVDTTSGNVDDDLRLDHLILPALPESVRDQLQDMGFLGGYALLPASNELCFKTQVAVRAALLTWNEWEYFAGAGEDMSSDKSGEVRKFMEPLLERYRGEATEKIQVLEEMRDGITEEDKEAVDLMLRRWGQVRDGVQAFLNG